MEFGIAFKTYSDIEEETVPEDYVPADYVDERSMCTRFFDALLSPFLMLFGFIEAGLTRYLKPLVYAHVEIYDLKNRTAYSIKAKGIVTREPRVFTSDSYTFHAITVSGNAYKRLFEFLDDAFDNEYPFNWRGYYYNNIKFSFMPVYDPNSTESSGCLCGCMYGVASALCIVNRGKSFFCSELISHALIESGILRPDSVYPPMSDPDIVYKALIDEYGSTVRFSRPGTESSGIRQVKIEKKRKSTNRPFPDQEADMTRRAMADDIITSRYHRN